LNPQDLEKTLQVVIAEEPNFQRAFALGITQMDLGAQPLPELVFNAGHVSILAWRRRASFGSPGWARLQFGDHGFRLPHIEVLFQDPVGGKLLLLFAGDSQDHLGMADREAAVADRALDRGREFEQAERICDNGAALSDSRRNLILFELELPDQLAVTLGFLDRVEILPLEIFDQREFQDRAVISFADDCRGISQAGKLGSPPAPFSGNQLKILAVFPNDERLKDPSLTNGIGKLLEGFGRKMLSRLQGAGPKPAQRNPLDAVFGIHRGNGCRIKRRPWRRCRERRLGQGRRSAQKSAQSTSQSRFCCHAGRVSDQRMDVNAPKETLPVWVLRRYFAVVTHKSDRISEMIEPFRGRGLDPHYLAYFDYFNREQFFEAHDVLEQLWLARKSSPDYAFHKGLIQLAGAFVHLQKRRLRPSAALFKLAESNLSPYAPVRENLDILAVLELIGKMLRALEASRFEMNPLDGGGAPKLRLQAGERLEKGGN